MKMISTIFLIALVLLVLTACAGQFSKAKEETVEAVENLKNEAVEIKEGVENTLEEIKEAKESVEEASEAINEATDDIKAIVE